jgi:peptidoglycan pentaglycine glycine transferase (the first glycine)
MNNKERYQLQVIPAGLREQWDYFVNNHPYGHVLQSWDWGMLKASAGWQPLRLALWDAHDGRIVAGAQVLRRTVPHLPLWVGHLAYVPKGPVVDWQDPERCTLFLRLLDRYIAQQNALALRLEPALEEGSLEAQFLDGYIKPLEAHRIHPVQPLRTILVDLSADEEELRRHMKEKWRYNVGLATRRGVTVRVADSLEDVRRWYDLLQVTSERDQFGVHTLDYYIYVWKLLNEHQIARLLLAEHEGQLLAGIFVTVFGNEGIYMYGASSNERRNLMPNYLLQWEAMRWAKSLGARQYDLWGIPDTDNEQEAMAGVYRFKSGWGGRVVRFVGCYERVYHPLAMQLARRFM